MKIKPFHTERFFARYEFSAPHLLSASDCEPLTLDQLLELAGRSWETISRLHLGYTETQGAPALRQAIAASYRSLGAEQIIGLSAPEEGIFLTMHALLEPGDQVIVLTPCYDSLANVAEYLGCQVRRWPLQEIIESAERSGGWHLDLAHLETLLTPQTKLVIVNFPHNPTGYLPAHEEWQTLVQLVSRAGAWLFSDEMYRGLEYTRSARLDACCDCYERAVTLGGLSKAYGLPGLRVGWLALQDAQLRDRILCWKDYTTICASAPSEALAEIALSIGSRLTVRNRKRIMDNLALADAFFARWHTIFRWNRPLAGSVALVGLQSGSASGFAERLVNESGVVLLPSPGLGFGDGHLRFGFGRESFAKAMAALERYLSS